MSEKLKLSVDLEYLQQDTVIGNFESEDFELNDFLINDAKKYQSSLLAVTYFMKSGEEIVAYFSLANDRLIKDTSGKSEWNRLNRSIANDKRRRNYPAVKIGRLAVAGCRFITVDAYQNALGFYQKNGFAFLTEQDETEATRAMYLDLMAFV
jgi:hypothetical protein